MRKSILMIFALYFLLFYGALPAMAKDWPNQYRDATNRNSVTLQPVFPFMQLAELNSQGIDPVVEGNIVITVDSDSLGQKVVAHRLASASLLWEYRLGNRIPRQPVIHRGTVYFGVISQPTVYAVGLLTGELRWQRNTPGESFGLKFAPVGVEDGLFVVGKSLHRLSLNDGQEQWNLSVVIDSPLAADENHLYLRRHDAKVSRVDIDTGLVTWSVNTGTTAGTTPLVTGSTIYVGTFRTILAIESSSGLVRWQYATTGQSI